MVSVETVEKIFDKVDQQLPISSSLFERLPGEGQDRMETFLLKRNYIKVPGGFAHRKDTK